MKTIEIIPLAQRKAARRGIKSEWVEGAISSPDQVVTGYGGRSIAHKKMLVAGKEYLLSVVYEERIDKFVVVPTYLTSQVDRYWKEE